MNNHYVDLLKTNYDHFNPYARKAYKAGHELAIEAAAAALGETVEKEKYRLLMRAITLEAFANHFSTDLFSSGHMRVPRKALPDYCAEHPGYTGAKRLLISAAGFDSLGHLLVHEQHDEDGEEGLWVSSNGHREPWPAFGDMYFGEGKSEKNRTMVYQMVQAGLEDIFEAFTNRNKTESKYYRQHWPRALGPEETVGEDVQEQYDYYRSHNHYPMFRSADPKKPDALPLEKRENAGASNGTSYQQDWTAKQALKERKIGPIQEAIEFTTGWH